MNKITEIFFSPKVIFNLKVYEYLLREGLPRWCSGEESDCQCRIHKRRNFNPWVGKIPWNGKWLPTSVFLPGEFHGQRNLVGYSQWGHKELHMTEPNKSSLPPVKENAVRPTQKIKMSKIVFYSGEIALC